MSIIETAPADPVVPVPKCPDCNGAGGREEHYTYGQDGEYTGSQPVMCDVCEGTGQDLHALRLAVIATFAHLIPVGARQDSTLGMLRDAQAEIDRLNTLLPAARAEAVCEAAEVLRRREMWAAAMLLEDHLSAGHPPPEHRRSARSAREAWENLLRAETLRVGSAAMGRVAQVGLAIAHYADSQGRAAGPATAVLARLACCSKAQVRRAVQVLLAAGMLHSHPPRPNTRCAYELVRPSGPVDWQQHLALYRAAPAAPPA